MSGYGGGNPSYSANESAPPPYAGEAAGDGGMDEDHEYQYQGDPSGIGDGIGGESAHHQYDGGFGGWEETNNNFINFPNMSTSSTSTATSTAALQSRLHRLRTESHDLGSQLTKKLATSRSGQSLLHIGPSLSTLPPDLQSLLESLRPIVTEVEKYETDNRRELARVVEEGNAVRVAMRRGTDARDCAEMYRDLVGAEGVVRRDVEMRMHTGSGGKKGGGGGGDGGGKRAGDAWDSDDEFDDDDGGGIEDELDHVTSLERTAYTTLHLLQELESSSAAVSAMTGASSFSSSHRHQVDDGPAGGEASAPNNPNVLPSLRAPLPGGGNAEKSRFLLKLAPRIRRLESDAAKCLAGRLESVLAEVRGAFEESESLKRNGVSGSGSGRGRSAQGRSANDNGGDEQRRRNDCEAEEEEERRLLMIGHCLRGLALLGRGGDAEGAFARVAVMPIVRSKLSMGRLDEGGSRGECAGLFFLLDDVANTVASAYGSVLRMSEGIFSLEDEVAVGGDGMAAGGGEAKADHRMEVDLVTCGVWVTVATALMADPGIKMAIFSPGIANVLQANYSALDTFLSELADNLLRAPSATSSPENDNVGAVVPGGGGESSSFEPANFSRLYYRPTISTASVSRAQLRIYAHSMTADFTKRWNLPIYYQLRFGEFCKRLDKALERVRLEGWEADVFTGDERDAQAVRESLGFELPVFLELYDALTCMWKSNVFLRPLTHRFLRGAVQLVGRTIAFVKDGMEGSIRFGGGGTSGPDGGSGEDDPLSYLWSDRVEDVAIVAWELTILDTCMTHDYLDVVAKTVCPPDVSSGTSNNAEELEEIRLLAADVLVESSQSISPLVSRSWNELIVGTLTAKCCIPLSAVKGVAATYRMTNRPPPTQASPFVKTILRPLSDFDGTYANRTPPQIGDAWKHEVIGTVASKYSSAVEELIATVKRTEDALKNRKTRRAAAGGMSDGEKVKLQLFLDHREFASHVEKLGVDGLSIDGLVKLESLTQEAESLYLQTQK